MTNTEKTKILFIHIGPMNLTELKYTNIVTIGLVQNINCVIIGIVQYIDRVNVGLFQYIDGVTIGLVQYIQGVLQLGVQFCFAYKVRNPEQELFKICSYWIIIHSI